MTLTPLTCLQRGLAAVAHRVADLERQMERKRQQLHRWMWTCLVCYTVFVGCITECWVC